MVQAQNPQEIRRRRVFYIPGYDPIHPRRYRELYRKESSKQAAISGYDIALRARKASQRYGWDVHATIAGQQVETQMEVLVWSDIVRTSMNTSIPATYAQLVRTAWVYISSGALWRLMKLRKGPVIAALYPVGMLLIQLALAVLVAVLIWRGAELVIGMLAPYAPGLTPLFQGLGATGAGLAGYALLRWFKAKDGRFFAYYLMHDYAYGAATRGANTPELETRIDAFAQTIAEALDSDVDEVLVVGHSSGAHLGVSVLADLLRARGPQTDDPRLGFLTLGQVVPMVSFLPKADRLRGDLAYMAAQETVPWIDVTAPGDGCAFALCDPVAVSGVAPEEQIWPLVVSAAFTQTLQPETWKALRWRFFRLHFQYLCAFDNPGDFDYFQITAGPVSLASRYAERQPSRSRITRAVNRFTSIA